ncbi:MAG TPA: STAS domain-containing protein [Gammaproteobacteria bacterium]
MNITTTTRDTTAIVSLSGDVDLETSPQVRKALLAALGSGSDAVLADLAEVTYIDSSGVASLVEALQKARGAGKRFALVAVSDAAHRVLELARLDRVFTIHASVEDACG